MPFPAQLRNEVNTPAGKEPVSSDKVPLPSTVPRLVPNEPIGMISLLLIVVR